VASSICLTLRSGKSFLLNQLLGVPCGEGFGVGHTRKTETKGVWVWGEPIKTHGDVSIVYVDTEGLEATGMSDAYDDRIFALSSIVASVGPGGYCSSRHRLMA